LSLRAKSKHNRSGVGWLSRYEVISRKAKARALAFSLSRRIQHILNKDPIPLGRIVDQYVRHRSDELAVL